MKNYSKLLNQITWLYVAYLIFTIVSIMLDFFDFGRGASDSLNNSAESSEISLLNKIIGIPFLVIIILLMVTMIKLLIHSTISVIKRDIFNTRLIKLITTFAIRLIIVLALATCAIYDTSNKALIKTLLDGFMDGVFMLIVSRILIICKGLKEEQDLTV